MQLDLERNKVDPLLVDQWLIRSCPLPLSISASLRNKQFHPIAAAIMDAIANHSERWHSIDFVLPSFCYGHLERVRGHLPNLQYINIEKEFWQPSRFPSLDLFSAVPQLRHLSLWGSVSSDFHFSTDNLIKLHMGRERTDICLNMLRDCPRIIDCTFEGFLNANDALIHVLPDQLESLDVHFDCTYTDQISDVFDALTTPALRNLTCIATSLRHSFPHCNFISLMARSSCSLRALTLIDTKTSDDQLIECLRATPTLEELSLTRTHTTKKILQMLTLRAGLSSILLPKLKTFKQLHQSDLDLPALASFLRSRWDIAESAPTNTEPPPSFVRLQSLDVDARACKATPDVHTMAELQRFVKEGMTIRLRTNRPLRHSVKHRPIVFQ
jgi:hypothetical protein